MVKWKIIAASIALSVPLVISSGVSVAQQFVCDPHCSPSYEDHHRGEGLQNANSKAGVHGSDGRLNAQQKQDAHRHGGSGVVPTPPPPLILDPTSTSTGDTSSVPAPSPTPTFSSGCSLC